MKTEKKFFDFRIQNSILFIQYRFTQTKQIETSKVEYIEPVLCNFHYSFRIFLIIFHYLTNSSKQNIPKQFFPSYLHPMLRSHSYS